MKKLFAAAILAVVLVSSAFANETYNFKGAEKFVTANPSAVGVTYKTTAEYTVVNFTVAGKELQSIYSLDGELMATSYAVTLKELPGNTVANIQKKYAGYEITEAIALDHAENGFNYYVKLKGQDRKIVLEVSENGNVSVFKTSKG